MSKFAKRQDATHNAIVKHLREQGVNVLELLLPLDTLCFYKGWTSWLEIKNDTGDEVWTRKQLQFISETPHNVIIAHSGDEAMYLIKTRSTVTQTQKDAVAGLLMRSAKKIFTAKDVREVLG